MNPHQLAEERSIAYHRALVAKIDSDPSLLEMARQRVSGWLDDGSVHISYAKAWQELLELPWSQLRDQLADTGLEMRDLRQCTPFAGGLDPRERWEIWRRVGEQTGAGLKEASLEAARI